MILMPAYKRHFISNYVGEKLKGHRPSALEIALCRPAGQISLIRPTILDRIQCGARRDKPAGDTLMHILNVVPPPFPRLTSYNSMAVVAGYDANWWLR